jgi:hypothetical protein
MPSEIEGRISLALQAYTDDQILSLRATAYTYDVPFETLRRRYLRVFLRKETIPNVTCFTPEPVTPPSRSKFHMVYL